jgi:hypothetical protein
MAHTVAEAAARAVKNSQRVVVETRTSEEIIKTMRNNLTNPLAILKSDVAVLMSAYDDQKGLAASQALVIADLNAKLLDAANNIGVLLAKLEEFRAVYDAENQNTTVKVEAVLPADQA